MNLESTIDSEGFKGGTQGAPIIPRDAVSRTANVGNEVGYQFKFLRLLWGIQFCRQNQLCWDAGPKLQARAYPGFLPGGGELWQKYFSNFINRWIVCFT